MYGLRFAQRASVVISANSIKRLDRLCPSRSLSGQPLKVIFHVIGGTLSPTAAMHFTRSSVQY